MSTAYMPPQVTKGAPPDLHLLGTAVFENLCRSLLEKELGISNCEQFGFSGQTQFGIDLIAARSDNTGHVVGQCKCYKTFDAADIKNAADEFLKFWGERWKDWSVTRFILMVACDLKDTKVRDQIASERTRFASLGVMFETWQRRTILQRLATWPPIIVENFSNHEHWIEQLTGFKVLPYQVPLLDKIASTQDYADVEIRSLLGEF